MNMENPLITVAIPVYNAERFIEKSLQRRTCWSGCVFPF